MVALLRHVLDNSAALESTARFARVFLGGELDQSSAFHAFIRQGDALEILVAT